jgi:PAS domain S-box-containing protein
VTHTTPVFQSIPWLAVASIASGVVSVGFMWYLWPYRNRLGGRFFIATIGCEALWALSYGVALFVFDPVLRYALEVPIWLAINFIGVFFLAFALEYTGRSELLRSKLMGGIVGLQVLHTLVVATNPIHGIAWTGYRIDPVFGLATVTYAHQPWLFVNAAGFVLMIAVASFLLAETVFSYGPLYRTQAAAIAISPIFPGLPFLLWLAKVGATPPLNLTPLLFPIHLAFDMYAFFSRDMFEMVPAARRVADRAAIDNLGTAVVIVDTDGRIIERNDEAARVLGLPTGAALGRGLSEYAPDIDPTASGQTATRSVDGTERTYAVTTSALETAGGTVVGNSVVLQDITAERRREQRLAVLNRVLRHNLRNDLNVVQGYLDIGVDRVDDPDLRRMLETAARKTADVIELGEKARTIENAMGSDAGAATSVAVRPLLEEIREDLQTGAAAEIRIEVPADLSIRTDPSVLRVVFENLIENGVEHGSTGNRTESDDGIEHTDADTPIVTVRALDADGGSVGFEIQDEGPGVPDHELDVLDATEETALEHGSGLGLWIVKWGVASLGGTVEFDVTDAGTTVRLELPNIDSDGDADATEAGFEAGSSEPKPADGDNP